MGWVVGALVRPPLEHSGFSPDLLQFQLPSNRHPVRKSARDGLGLTFLSSWGDLHGTPVINLAQPRLLQTSRE